MSLDWNSGVFCALGGLCSQDVVQRGHLWLAELWEGSWNGSEGRALSLQVFRRRRHSAESKEE